MVDGAITSVGVRKRERYLTAAKSNLCVDSVLCDSFEHAFHVPNIKLRAQHPSTVCNATSYLLPNERNDSHHESSMAPSPATTNSTIVGSERERMPSTHNKRIHPDKRKFARNSSSL